MKTAIEILEAKIPEIKTRKSDYSVMDIRVMNVLEIMEEYANQSKWISVETELPPKRVMEISDDVIVVDENGVFMDCYDYEFNQWCRLKYKSTVTHWQPLPNAPEKP